jgi:hypothetical protein
MTQRRSSHQSGKSRAKAQFAREIATTAVDDELVLMSLVETFPASDPPAWIPLARVGVPERRAKSKSAPKSNSAPKPKSARKRHG